MQRPTLGEVASSVGRGLAAGLVGTAVMTVSSTIEQKLRDRGASSAPADAASEVLGIDGFEDDDARDRFSNLTHWGYGTGWGAVRGVIGATGVGAVPATIAHTVLVYATEQVMLPALDVAPPATEWGAEEIAIDAWHHAVYGIATGVAYELLDGQRT